MKLVKPPKPEARANHQDRTVFIYWHAPLEVTEGGMFKFPQGDWRVSGLGRTIGCVGGEWARRA